MIDGVKFHSKREGARYLELKELQQAGEISGLKLQVKFPIIINGEKVTTYISDFVYYDKKGCKIVEDSKGFKTDIYKLKRKLLKAVLSIDIFET